MDSLESRRRLGIYQSSKLLTPGCLLTLFAMLSVSRPLSAQGTCQAIFGANYSFVSYLNDSLLVPKAKNLSQEVADERIAAVFDHQNFLRASRGVVPIKHEELLKAQRFYRFLPDGQWPVGQVFIPSKTDWFLAYENGREILVFPRWDDTQFFNYAYEFDGARIIRSIPIAQYFLERYKNPNLILYRSMSEIEFQLWQARDFEKLTVFEKQWGYQKPIVHLKPESFWSETTDEHRILRFDVPKAVLLKWAMRNEVGLGMMNRRLAEYEIVVPSNHWRELIRYATIER